MRRHNQFLAILIYLLLFVVSCVKPSSSSDPSAEPAAPESSVGSGSEQTDVLIYGGPGSWRAEIEALKSVLYANGATYEELKPDKLNKFSLDDFGKYKVILFAGGDAPTVRASLEKETRALIREAVQSRGLNYIGFCAGAWLAVAPKPDPTGDVVYGLGVVDGPVSELNFLSKKGLTSTLDIATFANGESRKLLWYGGPITFNSQDSIVAKYSDGTPAISQVYSGKGLVIMSGLHPAANKSILTYLGLYEREAVAPDYAWELLRAVIQNQPLPTF